MWEQWFTILSWLLDNWSFTVFGIFKQWNTLQRAHPVTTTDKVLHICKPLSNIKISNFCIICVCWVLKHNVTIAGFSQEVKSFLCFLLHFLSRSFQEDTWAPLGLWVADIEVERCFSHYLGFDHSRGDSASVHSRETTSKLSLKEQFDKDFLVLVSWCTNLWWVQSARMKTLSGKMFNQLWRKAKMDLKKTV